MDDRSPLDRKLQVLREVPLFSDLDDRSLEAISVLAREVELPADQILMLEGEPGDAFYVIVDGTVRIERGGRTIRSMMAGGFLGEIALLDHRARTATAICVTDCRLLALQHHEFDRLVDTFPAVHRRVRAAIARRAAGTGGDSVV
ncbi:MAG TPA: cyclic nucleotide-binding domain-containing protein [Candidatus Eisenbacteria bacterium]|nr:cyclic nucleotide-binding domain-containing protein [Candidatus Eisenbacteria bacterium]